MASSERVKALNSLYQAVTGEDMFLYMTEPGGGETAKFAFHAGTVQGQKAAEGYMRWALNQARGGRSHQELVYDGVHAEAGRYFFDAI
jgi:hypothetical protein